MNNYLGNNIKFLRKRKGLTQEQLADKLGVKRSMIGSYEESRAVPKIESLQFLAHYFSVNLDQLISMDLSATDDSGYTANEIKGKSLRILTTVVNREESESILVVPQRAAAGYLSGYSDPDFIEKLPQIALHLPEMSKERTYRAFQITGESMLPVLPGTYIITEYVQNWTDVKNLRPFIFVTKSDGIVYKRAQWVDDESILMKSDNPEYQPYQVNVNEIVEVWKAIATLSFKLPEADEYSANKLAVIINEMRREIDEIKKNTMK